MTLNGVAFKIDAVTDDIAPLSRNSEVIGELKYKLQFYGQRLEAAENDIEGLENALKKVADGG